MKTVKNIRTQPVSPTLLFFKQGRPGRKREVGVALSRVGHHERLGMLETTSCSSDPCSGISPTTYLLTQFFLFLYSYSKFQSISQEGNLKNTFQSSYLILAFKVIGQIFSMRVKSVTLKPLNQLKC